MSKSAVILEVIYEYPALPDWVQIGPSGVSVPTGVPVTFALRWQNTGSESLEARAYLKTVDPAGEEYSLRPDIWYPMMEPGEEIWVYYETITFSMTGTYTVLGYVTEGAFDEALDWFELPVTVGSGSSMASTLSQVMPIVIMAVALGVTIPMMRGATKELEGDYGHVRE